MDNIVSLEDIWRFFVRQRVRIAKATGATLAVVMILTFLSPPTYQATALLLVKFGREYMYRPSVGEREVDLSRRDTFINTELQILRSQDLVRSAVLSVGVNQLYPSLSDEATPGDTRIVAAAASRFARNLVAERMPQADVLRVDFRHSDPEMTAKALNQFIDKFQEQHLLAFSEPKARTFLEEKVTQYREELTKVEETLKALQIDSKSFSIDDQHASLFQQRRQLEGTLKETRNHIAGLEQKLSYLRSERDKASRDPSRLASEQNKAISDARAQLLDLELQEQKLVATFSETSRQVVGIRKQIALVKDFLERQREVIGQGQFAEDLEKQIVAAVAELRFEEAKRNNLAAQLAQLETELGRVPAQEAEYRNLVREREAAEKNYQTYVKKLEEARLSEDMDKEKIANISVIQAASVPLAPVWPSKPLNVLVGLILGTAIGIGWAFASERLEERRRARQPLEDVLDELDQLLDPRRAVRESVAAEGQAGVVGGPTAPAGGSLATVDGRAAIPLDGAGRLPAPDAQAPDGERAAGAAAPLVDGSEAEARLAQRDQEPKWEPAGPLALGMRTEPQPAEAVTPPATELAASVAPASTRTAAERLARAARWMADGLLNRVGSLARWRTWSLSTQAAESVPTGDDRDVAIPDDPAASGLAPATQESNRERGRGGRRSRRRRGRSRPRAEVRDAEAGEGTAGEGLEEAAEALGSQPPEGAAPAATLYASVMSALGRRAPMLRLSFVMAWAGVALAVLAGGGGVFAVWSEAAPPRAVRDASLPTGVGLPSSAALGSEAKASDASEATELLQAESAAAKARVRELEEKLAALEAERAAARAKARDRVVAPAASAKPQDQERIARQDQERREQQEARRREEERQALEALLAEERKRAEEAAAAEEAVRAAAALMPPVAPSAGAALPEPGVRPGQLVSLDDPSVIAPVAQRAPAPPYPPIALRQRVEGTVVLNVLVDETGKVADTQVVSAAGGKTGLNEAAVDYVRQWMFRGATKDGVPVKVWYPVKVDFRLPR